MVEMLVGQGGEVGRRDEGGLVPLHNAASFGHADVAALLLRYGADPNAKVRLFGWG